MSPTGDAPQALAGLPLDHVAIAVAGEGAAGLDAAATPFRLLGLRPVGPDEEVPTQGVRVRALGAGPTLVELLAPTVPDGPVARFVARRGPGLHHIALRVPDLDAALHDLRDAGARLLDDAPRPGRAGSRVAFVHPSFAGGVLIELVQP